MKKQESCNTGVDADVIQHLCEKWKKEDDEIFNKIIFMKEHNFKMEEILLREIREKTVKRRFELEHLIKTVD